jgi:putative membrane protein
MNWKQKVLAAAGFAALALPAFGQTGSSTTESKPGATSAPPQSGATDGTTSRGEDREAMVLGFIHHVNQREIEMGNLAKENGSSKQVKDFADRIIKDHKSAEEQVQKLANSRHIDLGALHSRKSEMKDQIELERRSKAIGSATGEYAFMTEPGRSEEAAQAMAEHKAVSEKLHKLKGAEFDREFTRAMVKDHQMVIERLTRARTRIKDPELTSLVDKLLPTLKEHLSTAQKLQDNLSKA